MSRKVGEKQMKCSGFWQCFSKKEAFAVYLEGLGTAASEDNGIKKIVGVNFEGLGGTPQAESSPIKTIVGYNFVGLGLVNSSAAQGSQDEWDESIEDTASQESGDTNGEWGYDQSAEYYNFSESSTIVYVGETSIPLASYRNTFGKYLWIENYGGLSEYASIPQYSGLSLIAYTSTGGQGEFLEIYPSDSSNQELYQRTYFNFNPGYNRIPYRGDVAGRHYLLFTMGDQPSNSIIIDVNGDEAASSQPVLGTAPGGGMA